MILKICIQELCGSRIDPVGNYLDNLNLPAWDGSVADSYAGGDGTESNPYQINSGVNGFASVFDGQQHTIYGMYSQHGI